MGRIGNAGWFSVRPRIALSPFSRGSFVSSLYSLIRKIDPEKETTKRERARGEIKTAGSVAGSVRKKDDVMD